MALPKLRSPLYQPRLGVAGIAVGAICVLGLPIVGPEVRLREADQHADVVGGTQDLLESDVRAGIVRVDEVDTEAF